MQCSGSHLLFFGGTPLKIEFFWGWVGMEARGYVPPSDLRVTQNALHIFPPSTNLSVYSSSEMSKIDPPEHMKNALTIPY